MTSNAYERIVLQENIESVDP